MIIKRNKDFINRYAVSALKWYNKGKMKPDVISSLLEKSIFWAKQGIIPNFKEPTNWGEFVCHRKFYGDYETLASVADKKKVRKYVEHRIGNGYLKKLFDVVKHEDDIDEGRYLNYPEQFVVKPNHASERVYINNEYNYPQFITGIRGFLNEFGNRNNEFHYKHIDKKLMIEEYLNPKNDPLKEYKVWVFHGKAEFIVPSLSVYESKLNNDYRFRLYDRNWEEPEIQVRENLAAYEDPPKQLQEIIKVCEELAKGWDFIRVDLFLADDHIKFGELTPTPSAGRSFFLSLADHRYIYDTFLRKGLHSPPKHLV